MDDDELRLAMQMSMQGVSAAAAVGTPPEAKRNKPRDGELDESDGRSRWVQRELMAEAAEKRIRAAAESRLADPSPSKPAEPAPAGKGDAGGASSRSSDCEMGEELSEEDADQLFSMVFGSGASKNILAQWSNQGIRFSPDPETCMGLVQHEAGPCGVLATLQAFILKYLLFFQDELGASSQIVGQRRQFKHSCHTGETFASITEDRKMRALVYSMVEILFLCGNNQRGVVATLNVCNHLSDRSGDCEKNEAVTKALEGLSVESGSDLQRVLRVKTYSSQTATFDRLINEIPVLQSRMGAMLFLISALLSRGLEAVQADRDDPTLPLVTAPFGHASQEIVSLLLCGQAVPNVFDGSMDLGGGMSLKGIPSNVEVGFLTLLESLGFCKVGQFLKSPKWPIWVVGSESHYTVLFALDTSVQDENELEERESRIRKAFDAHDHSDGGGFISSEGFHHVLRETNIDLPLEKINNISSSGIVVWSEFSQALLELDKSFGGLKDSSGLMGRQQFDLYHFNGIAKSVSNGNAGAGGDSPLQRPTLCKVSVSVPSKWTQEDFLGNMVSDSSGQIDMEMNRPSDPSLHAPLVDCIRTRWPRALCDWVGDAPSIV